MSHALADPLAWALAAFRDETVSDRYKLYADYAAGDHDVAFVTLAYRNAFRDLLEAKGHNFCRRVVDAHADRLRIVGFSDEHEGDDPAGDPDAPIVGDSTADAGVKKADAPAAKAWALWRAGRMGKRSGEVHQEALAAGDAYVIVEKHPVTDEVCVWPQKAQQIRVHYGDERPGEIDVAAKKWRLHDGRARVNLYFADRIEKWVSRHKEESGPSVPKTFEKYTDEPDGPWPVVLQITDTVPVFHFGNNARTGELGVSILSDVVPIQDKLNKAVHDTMVAGEYGAFRQRWAVGVSPLIDPDTGLPVVGPDGKPISPFQSGPGTIWTATAGDDGSQPRFGDFAATDIGQYIDQKKDLRVDIAIVSATPLRYFSEETGGAASGEARKVEEAPLVAVSEDRQEAFGDDWGAVVRYQLRLFDGTDAPGLVAEWRPASARSERETAELGALYLQSGWPEEEVWRFQGKTEDEVRRMRAEKGAAQEAETERQEAATARELARFAAGGERGGDGEGT